MAFRKRAQAEEFNSALARKEGQDINLQPDEQESIWSVAHLKKLTVQQLENKLEEVEEQSTLIKWRIWWAIRQKFDSDRLFGEHINELRLNSTRPGWPSSPRDISRSIAAGRFCEKHRISDLNTVRIYKESIYLLMSLKDEGIAGKILSEIRRRHTEPTAVRKMIDDATTVVSTIEKRPEVTAPIPGSSDKRHLQVASGIVVEKQIDFVDWINEDKGDQAPVRQENEINPAIAESSTALMMQAIQEDDSEQQVITNNVNRRMGLLLELAREEATYMTEQQMKDEIKMLVMSYRLGFLKEAGLLQTCAKEISAKGYGK